jgi:peptide/nickel transport system permease protein
VPERAPDSVVDDTELVAEAAHEILPVDAGLEVGMLAVEAGDEGAPRKKLGFAAWLAIAWLVILIGACALAPVIGIPEYKERFDNLALQQPFCTASDCVSGHPLGGDHLGRDMTSRLVYGARNSLFIAIGSVVIGIVVGGFLGLLAGYRRGRLETVVMGAMDVLLSIPALILALSLAIFLEPTMTDAFGSKETAGRLTLTFALGLIAIPTLARITRANTLVWSQREFVTAARAQGAKDYRIMFREVLPNVVPAMAAIALLAVAVVVVAEVSLSILGAGIDPPAPTWGNIIFEGVKFLTNGRAPHMVLEASIFIFLTVMSLNYLGDAVRAKFDVREAGV